TGFYKRYRYGLRWFGDFRRAIAGESHSFCIDLGYWYAAPRYRYRPQPAAAHLRNRAGKPVALERQRELSYAIWRYSRSTKPSRQAAVMLFVHSRMGDARPGELDAAALSPAVDSLYRRIARDSARYHGPYTLKVQLPATLTVGDEATATVRLLSAHGHPMS